MPWAEHHVSCGECVAIRHKQLLFWGKLDLWVSCTLGCHHMTLSRVVRGRHLHFKLTLSEYTQTTYENNSHAKALSSNVCVVFSCKMVGNSHLEPEISRIKQCVAGLISGVWTKRLLLYTHEPNQTFSPNICPIKGGLGVWPSHVRSGFISSCLWQEAAVMCRSLFLPLHVHAVLCDSPSPFTCGPLHLPLMRRSAPMWPADVHLMGHLLLMLY